MRRIKLVLIGGGTGLSVLARGLKDYPIDITTIVTVADDGGSTGKIRNEMDIPAPGDIRNVISALSETESTLEQLFQYRFKENQVEGHSLGNLLIAALTNITDDFGHAVMEDGEIVYGESKIPKKNKKIERVFLEPEDVKPMEEAVEAIEEADLIVMGPGSLYTSVISNLCVKGIADALLKVDAPKLYVSNVMTQPGETNNYSAVDHVNAIHDHMGAKCINYVICSTQNFHGNVLERYREENAEPVKCNTTDMEAQNIKVFTHPDLVEVSSEDYVRHNTEVLSKMIYEIAMRETATIEFNRNKDHNKDHNE